MLPEIAATFYIRAVRMRKVSSCLAISQLQTATLMPPTLWQSRPTAQKKQPGHHAQNRRARHDYFIEQKFEAGVMLMGWEVSIRDGKVQLAESYVQLHKGEAF